MEQKNFYKAQSPYSTVNQIRQILYRAGIFISEKSDSYGMFYHSHISIANDGVGDLYFMTNGKGVSAEYSLASAYAEMMERLQNYFFFSGQYGTKAFCNTLPQDSTFVKKMSSCNFMLDYAFAKDEKHYSLREYFSSNDTVSVIDDKNTSYIKQTGDNELLDNFDLLCVPYVDILTGTTKYMPAFNPHTGSNGMCAGNTTEEALVQGFCELFERYAVKQVFLNGVIPPQIPLKMFEGTSIFERIKSHPELKVIIMDCSMEIGLPVIGALIINVEKNLYRFEFGCATSPTIALERCLTEHFQSIDAESRMQPMFKKTQYVGRTAEDVKFINYYHQVTTAEGQMDIEHFLMSEPSYPFKNLTYISGNSHQEELHNIWHLLIKNGYHCYIRDNSILGFPTFHIYIPEISNVFEIKNESDIYQLYKNAFYNRVNLDIKNKGNKNVLHKACINRKNMLEQVHSYTYNPVNEFLFNTNMDYNDVPAHLLLSTMFLYCGDNHNAMTLLKQFIETESAKNPSADLNYYRCAYSLLDMIENKVSEQTIKEKLSIIYSESIAQQVLCDLKDFNKALDDYQFPTCFNCDKCPVVTTCRFFNVMELIKKIQVASVEKRIDLFDLFNGGNRKAQKE